MVPRFLNVLQRDIVNQRGTCFILGSSSSYLARTFADEEGAITTSQNELWSRFGKLFFPSSPDVPALLPAAMLPRQARGTHKRTVYQTYSTVHFGT